MELQFTAKTEPECKRYLSIEYQEQKYSLEEFSKVFKEKEFQLEKMIPECVLIYKNKKIDYVSYKDSRMKISDQLEMQFHYMEHICQMEIILAVANFNYYKAAKFLEKAENSLQTARYYLMQAADIIEYDCNIPWRYGYQPIFDVRTMNFTTAIVWYNNCFDYILQIPFLAFELYKKSTKYKANMSFEEILQLCTFREINNICQKYDENDRVRELGNVLKECRVATSELNRWANYAKHKGGIGYIGLKPKSPFQVYVGRPGDEVESRTSEFDMIELDLDESIEVVINSHKALVKCIDRLVEFINFEAAQYRIDEKGNFDIPKPSTYVPIILE